MKFDCFLKRLYIYFERRYSFLFKFYFADESGSFGYDFNTGYVNLKIDIDLYVLITESFIDFEIELKNISFAGVSVRNLQAFQVLQTVFLKVNQVLHFHLYTVHISL